jgi:hypothetical protein
VNGAIFASYQHLGTLMTATAFAAAKASELRAFATTSIGRTNRHFLQSVDYTNPQKPVLSPDHPNLPGRLAGTAREGKVLFTTGPHYDSATGAPNGNQPVLHASALDGKVVHLLDQLPFAGWQPPLLRGQTIFHFQAEPAKIWIPSNEPGPIGNLPIPDRAVFNSDIGLSVIGTTELTLVPRLVGSYVMPGTFKDNPKKSTLTTWELGADGKFAKLGEAELAHENNFNLVGNLGLAWERVNQPRLLDISDPASIGILGFLNLQTPYNLNYGSADGGVSRGLWIPTGDYGVESVVFGN